MSLYTASMGQDVDPGKSIDLMGMVIEKSTNAPAKVNLVFRDENGNEFRTESNPETGWYQLLLPPADYYTVTLHSPFTLQKVERVNLKSMKLSDRQAIDFYVQKLALGVIVDSLKVFEDGKAIFRKNAEYLLDAVIANLKGSSNVKFNLICLPGNVSYSPELLAGRAAKLKSYLEKWNSDPIYPNLIIGEANRPSDNSSGQAGKNTDLVITIWDITEQEK